MLGAPAWPRFEVDLPLPITLCLLDFLADSSLDFIVYLALSNRSSKPKDSSALGSNFLSVLTTTNSPGFGTMVSFYFPYNDID